MMERSRDIYASEMEYLEEALSGMLTEEYFLQQHNTYCKKSGIKTLEQVELPEGHEPNAE